MAGQSKNYNLSLDGPSPSFTFSWADALGQSVAVSLKSHQIPYPLPQAGGGLCGLEVTSLEWTPGQITGVVASECVAETGHEVALPVYGGHFSQTTPALLDSTVTRITGTVNVAAGSAPRQRVLRCKATRPASPWPSPTGRRSTTWKSRRTWRQP